MSNTINDFLNFNITINHSDQFLTSPIRNYNSQEFISTFPNKNIPNNPQLKKDFYQTTTSSLIALDSISHLMISTQNINGLHSLLKQRMLLDALMDKQIGICGLTDTRLSENLSKNFYKYDSDYQPYWNPKSSTSQSGGVGILLNKRFVTMVQSVSKWKDRILHLDLYLEGRIKFRIVVLYIPTRSIKNKQIRKETIIQVKKIVKDSQAQNFNLIIMGDLNSNHTDYYNALSNGRCTSQWELLEFLDHNAMVDIHPSIDGISPATYEQRSVATGRVVKQSRIDGIWVSQSLLTEIFFSEVWNPSAYYQTDHKMILVFLSAKKIFKSFSFAKCKQRGQKRTLYQWDKTTKERWESFAIHMDNELLGRETFSLLELNSQTKLNSQ